MKRFITGIFFFVSESVQLSPQSLVSLWCPFLSPLQHLLFGKRALALLTSVFAVLIDKHDDDDDDLFCFAILTDQHVCDWFER